jgi:hypothetical protein
MHIEAPLDLNRPPEVGVPGVTLTQSDAGMFDMADGKEFVTVQF